MMRLPSRSTLFPYTTLFRSQDLQRTLPATWLIADGRVTQLGEDPLEPPRLLEGGRYAIETDATPYPERSEEHTSELQSLAYLVCRLLLEKKKQIHPATHPIH